MPLASTNLTLFCLTSKVLHTPVSTQTNFYTSQLLQTLFYTNHFLQKPTLTPTSFYTNLLLHNSLFRRTPFTPTSSFRPTTVYTNQVLHQPTCTNQFLHKSASTQTTFYANQLYTTPWARPKARGAECRNYQITCFQCLQLNDQRSSTVNLLTLSLLSLLRPAEAGLRWWMSSQEAQLGPDGTDLLGHLAVRQKHELLEKESERI